jgi:hypothetical protein
MATAGPPIPTREPLIEEDGRIRQRWIKWLQSLRDGVDAAPTLETELVALTAQTATIGTTPIPSGTLSEGYYRVSVYLRVTTAAAVSGSVQVTIHHTSGGVACTEVGTLLNANATNVPQSDVFLVKVDGATPVSYSVSYASNPGAALAYELTVILERVSA